MKKDPPDSRAMESFHLIQLPFIAMVVLASIAWEVQDFVASFAATEMTTTTTLRTTEERDDARVLRAFNNARRSLRINAELATESNPKQQTRDARLTLTAKSKRETLDNRESMVQAMRSAFASEGPGELYDVGNAPHATPVPNDAMLTIKRACIGLAIALFATGLIQLVLRWKRAQLPKAALLGILATALTLILTMLGREGASIWGLLFLFGLPMAFIGLLVYVTLRVQRAKSWQQAMARITESKVEVVRHRFAGDTTKVTNKAAVTYQFTAGAETISSDRISVGLAPSDQVDVTLSRYPVGAQVPVFYDPANPNECALERTPPVSLGCLWTGALAGLLVYALALSWFNNGWSVNTVAINPFPSLHHPFAVIGLSLFGLLCLASGLWNRRHQRKAFAWLHTKGKIVSSVTESYLESTAGRSHSQHRYYKPVIEFAYTVAGQEYHNTVGATNVVNVSIAGDQAGADAQVARYPAGLEVEVFYDPKSPTRSALEVDTEMMLTGTRSLVVAGILFVIALYVALH